MKTLATRLNGPVLLAPVVRGDERGFFLESLSGGLLPELGIAGSTSSRTIIPARGGGPCAACTTSRGRPS